MDKSFVERLLDGGKTHRAERKFRVGLREESADGLLKSLRREPRLCGLNIEVKEYSGIGRMLRVSWEHLPGSGDKIVEIRMPPGGTVDIGWTPLDGGVKRMARMSREVYWSMVVGMGG
jgi:hypothetical protein